MQVVQAARLSGRAKLKVRNRTSSGLDRRAACPTLVARGIRPLPLLLSSAAFCSSLRLGNGKIMVSCV